MFSRCWSGVKKFCHVVKNAIGAGKRALLGSSIVVNRSGGAAFTGDKFAGRLLRVTDASNTPLGRGLSTYNLLTAMVLYTYTRFFNAFRSHKRKKRASFKYHQRVSSQQYELLEDTGEPSTSPPSSSDSLLGIEEKTGNISGVEAPHRPHLHVNVGNDSPVIYDGADASPPLIDTPPHLKLDHSGVRLAEVEEDYSAHGCDLFLLLVAENAEISPKILEEAESTNTPILIKCSDEYYIYGDESGNGQWDFTDIAIDPTEYNFNELLFSNNVVKFKRTNSLFNSALINIVRQAHAKVNEPSIPVASFCYPGTQANSFSLSYLLSQLMAGFYCIGSGASTILNVASLIKLLETWISFEYDSKCDDHSNLSQLIAVNFANLILLYANLYSFKKYNVPALREYFKNLFLEKRLFNPITNKLFAEYKLLRKVDADNAIPLKSKITGTYNNSTEDFYCMNGKLYNKASERVNYYKGTLKNQDNEELILHNGFWEISGQNKLEVFVGITLGSICIFYNNQHLNETVFDTIICHLVSIDKNLTNTDTFKFYSILSASSGAFANFIINGMMTLGAIFNKHERARKKEEYRLLLDPNAQTAIENNSRWQKICSFFRRLVTLPTVEKNMEFGDVLRRILTLCVWSDGWTTAQSTFTAVTDLPNSTANRDDLIYHPAIIATAIVSCIITAKNSMALDIEGLARESENRRLIREARGAREAARHEREMQEVVVVSNGVNGDSSQRRMNGVKKSSLQINGMFRTSSHPSHRPPSNGYDTDSEISDEDKNNDTDSEISDDYDALSPRQNLGLAS